MQVKVAIGLKGREIAISLKVISYPDLNLHSLIVINRWTDFANYVILFVVIGLYSGDYFMSGGDQDDSNGL